MKAVAGPDRLLETAQQIPYLESMGAAEKYEEMSVECYLASELTSPIKHEYVNGAIYNMAGGTNAHHRIASNILGSLHGPLRGKPCKPFNSDTKIRVRSAFSTRFYYPDVTVVCKPNPLTDTFQDDPIIIVEVVSPGTRRIDEGEKKDAYLSVPSLAVYLLVEQAAANVRVHRRTDIGFVQEEYNGLECRVPLPEIQAELALMDIYEDVPVAARMKILPFASIGQNEE
ncbi:Uma2 family endonuclease [Prosthecobacter sp. SYSU 5D2]|uniref:Uma2 family endonuclease n=1 Tax=Prosthecobacter sp. SYSU 5D2 TaxID=3134134 RepID=UPI0031FF0A46